MTLNARLGWHGYQMGKYTETSSSFLSAWVTEERVHLIVSVRTKLVYWLLAFDCPQLRDLTPV